jgi:hypothetical protein
MEGEGEKEKEKEKEKENEKMVIESSSEAPPEASDDRTCPVNQHP